MYYTNNYLLNPRHNIKICVIGVGGTGSFLLTELASLSETLKKLGRKGFDILVFDDDKVEEHNVFKQKFFPSDIGKYKAEVLCNRINRIYNMDIEYCLERFRDEHLNNYSPNIIISCVDNVATRKLLNKRINEHKSFNSEYKKIFYWIDTGNSKDFGQVILSAYHNDKKKRLPSVIDLYPKIKEDKNEPSCSMRAALNQQSFMVNKMTGLLAVQMLSSIFIDFCIDYSEVYFNLKNMSIKSNKI